MSGGIKKWRPSLRLVLGGALAGTLALSFVGLIALRYLGPEVGFRTAAVFLAIIIAVLTVILWLLLLRLLLRPVSALARFAAGVRSSPASPVPPPEHFGTDEVFSMGQSVIEMAATLQNREATIRSYTDHVTHELKTPVTAIAAAAELLTDSDDLTPQDRRLVDQLQSAGAQIQQHLNALRRVVRAREASHHGQCCLDDLQGALKRDHPGLRIQIDGGTIVLPLNASGLGIVLQHLLMNAAEAGAKSVHLQARKTAFGPCLCIADDGPGISDGNRPHVFDPFFTTLRDSGGTGMGLAIVAGLLAAHGARILLVSSATGAAFDITFPDA